ncbi:hypothetical protein SAMN05518672_103265 [Chitinophaga sp. CF118]|uniref:hypothetical protein n=1 Tax=Chitinophaga sp. CF118 TaxID=1884367 RepID=UPI0008F29D9B|nr:hypothetical protein [Chitinophaga sp. CF118]SFD80028.1 hypothetical protein SAMN05518672_103265 [Chitinophaga sp. CF118]
MKTSWIFNPFTYIAGLKSLIIGWILILITACIAYYSKTHFDGVVDAHVWLGDLSIKYYFLEPVVDWGCLVLVIFLAGKFFSVSSIRFIDVAGTLALARAPMLFLAIVNFALPGIKDIYQMDALAILAIFTTVILEIWMIALMYNAFKVSCNIKGNKAVGVFIASLIIAEIFSKIFLHLLYQPLK